jgi:hypothetical protein
VLEDSIVISQLFVSSLIGKGKEVGMNNSHCILVELKGGSGQKLRNPPTVFTV